MITRCRPRGRTSSSRYGSLWHHTWLSLRAQSTTYGNNPDVSQTGHRSNSGEQYGSWTYRNLSHYPQPLQRFEERYYPRHDGIGYAGAHIPGAPRADLLQRVTEALI